MPTESFSGKPGWKCEGCSQTTHTRKEMKKHIYFMRKDRNKDGKNHR